MVYSKRYKGVKMAFMYVNDPQTVLKACWSLEHFFKTLFGTTEGTYSAHVFRPVKYVTIKWSAALLFFISGGTPLLKPQLHTMRKVLGRPWVGASWVVCHLLLLFV